MTQDTQDDPKTPSIAPDAPQGVSNRILLLGDHAQRDVPGLAAVKVALEDNTELGKRTDTRIVSFDLWQQALELFMPHVVVLNHLHGRRNEKIADTVRRRGGLAVVLPSEGRPNTDSQVGWAISFRPELCDLYCSWTGTLISGKDSFNAKLPSESNPVATGCQRFDFYRSLARHRLSRERMCGVIGLDPSKPIITIASSFPNAKFAYRGQSFHVDDWKDLKVDTIQGREDPTQFAISEHEQWQQFMQWINSLALNIRDAQFIVKVHPAEDTRPWQELALRNPRLKLLLIGFMHDFLNMSDCHVGRSDCMTIPEAWLSNVPTISIRTPKFQAGPGWESTMHTDYLVEHYQQLEDAVGNAISHGTVSGHQDQKAGYIEKWLGPDGASEIIAVSIAKLILRARPKTPKDPTPQQYIQLHNLLWEHDKAHGKPTPDHIGQFGKSVRISAANEWIKKLKV